MKTIRYVPARRVIGWHVLSSGIALMSGCDIAGSMTTDQTTALGTLAQNLSGFFFDFARQLIAAFVF